MRIDCLFYRGAADGAGLGNAFLSNIAAVDGIFHVCRAFVDPDVTHVEDRVDPVDDLDIIHAELRAKDIERVNNSLKVDTHPEQNCLCPALSILAVWLVWQCKLLAIGEGVCGNSYWLPWISLIR